MAGPLPATLAMMLGLLGTTLSIAPRPQLASFVLLSLVAAAWLRTDRDWKPRWWLIGLSWLWACTHGLWFTGPLVGFAVVTGMLLDGRVSRKQSARLYAVPLLSIIAAAATPVGPKLLLAPLATSGMAPFVTDWQPPDFSNPIVASAAGMLALIVVTWSRSSRTSWSRLLLLLLAAGCIVLSYRTVALGAVIAVPLLASCIQSWLPTRPRPVVSARERRFLLAGLIVCVVGLTVAVPTTSSRNEFSLQQVDAALQALPPGTVVYNEYTLGGWLEWKHPNIAPVVDGMTDAYQVDHVRRYVSAGRLQKGWYRFITQTHAEYALFPTDAPLALELRNHMRWSPVVTDSGYVLLRRQS